MNRIARLTIVAAVAGLLTACGGGGGGVGGAPSTAATPPPVSTPPPVVVQENTGTVAILITDAPGHDYDEAFATITAIELIGDEDRVTIFEGEETIDLLRLADFYEFFAVSDQVPSDTVFNKIRLTTDKHVELRKLNDDGTVAESVLAELPGRGKLDLNNQAPFSVSPGAVLIIEVDWQMNKSFHLIETGNGKLKIRPVIMVNVTSGATGNRLARIFGVIDDIDESEASFRLCRSDLISDDDEESASRDDDDSIDSDYCVRVQTDDRTGLFGEDGLPIAFSGLIEDDEVTAIGVLSADERDDVAEVEIPDGFLPPPGECRVWLLDEPDPGQQPAPGNCDDLAADLPDDAVLIDDEGDVIAGGFDDDFVLSAITVERGAEGTFGPWQGAARSALDAQNVFEFEFDAGQGFVPGTSVATQIFDTTRFVTREGDDVDFARLRDGLELNVDGVLALSGDQPDVLRAALLIADLDDLAEDVLRGTVADIDEAAGTLLVTTDTGDRCVDATEAGIFVVEADEDEFLSNKVELGDLAPGQRLDVFGQESIDGCFLAETIIAEALEVEGAPTADAGDDQAVTTGDTVTLDGSGSSDPDGDELTYAWTLVEKPSGSSAVVSDADTAAPSFVADLAGDYVLLLVVSDGVLADEDEVVVTATD